MATPHVAFSKVWPGRRRCPGRPGRAPACLASPVRRWSRRRVAFSLLELLLVIAALIVLAGLLLPALARARRQAGVVQCQSNLRQWGLAALAYATANDDCLPRRGQGVKETTSIDRPEDWFNALPPLMSQQPYGRLAAQAQAPRGPGHGVWSCPEVTGEGQPSPPNFFSYAMNMRLSTWDAPEPDRIGKVGPAETMVFMTDGPGPFCSTMPAAAPYSPAARHGGSVEIAFLDGHVASYTGAEVGCGVGDPNRNDVRWAVPGSVWTGPSH